ncbi:coiled-coil domain-containing protein 33 [Pelodytes ibericus]
MPAPAALPAAPPGPPRLRLDDKVLSLEFCLLDAQFNEPGRYQLVLRVENPLLDGSVEGVTLSVNHGEVIKGNEAESDVAEQTDLTDTLNFQKDTFLFILPQGLCKNDKHHDVRLCIDVLKFEDDSLDKRRTVGQALFAIYPRTNQPRINLRAAPFQPFYNYQGVLALLRVGGNQMAMHCGRLAYNVCFREYQPPKAENVSKQTSPRKAIPRPGTSDPALSRHDSYHPETSKPATPTPTSSRPPISSTPRSIHSKPESPRQDTLSANYSSETNLPAAENKDLKTTHVKDHKPSADSISHHVQDDLTEYSDDSSSPSPTPSSVLPVSSRLPDDAPLLLPSPPKTPNPVKKTHVKEKPPPYHDSVHGLDGESNLLSPPGTETIVVTLHSATHLPSTTSGSVPSPFVTLMSSSDERNRGRAQSISHATQNPTHSPAWGESLTMTVNEEEVEQEELLLSVADSTSQDLLLTYRLPVRILQPFHTYHLSMIQSHGQVPGGCCLNVSIQRRSSFLTQQEGFTYSALQVMLGGVEAPLQGLDQPLLAVGRIVPNYTEYRKSLKPPGVCGVPHVTATFPNPAPSCFQFSQTASVGQPQISSLGLPRFQPVWNSSYLFLGRDGVTLFSEGAALVLEYYTVTNGVQRVPWDVSEYCGFSVVPLDMQVYHQLMSDSATKGNTFTAVTIEGTRLRTVSGEPPTVSLQLMLLTSEHPEFFLKPLEEQTQTDQQPQVLHPEIPAQGGAATHSEDLQRDGTSFPSHSALSDILPNPWTHPIHADQKTGEPGGLQGHSNSDPSPRYMSNKNMDLPADPVMEHEEQEIANYRLAMQRMADDIITLRRQMGGLEAENSSLRSERSMLQDAGRSMLSDADIDVMTKAEIADRLVTLKQKLSSETSELRGMRDRVHQLQNELVRKNDREKELLLLQRAHQQQQAVLQQYHQRAGRTRTLQDTVRKQEKVIEKMEKLLDTKLRDEKRKRVEGGERGGRMEFLQGEVYATLLAENSRLREELEKARQPVITLQPSIPMNGGQSQDVFSATEKFSLLSKLEKSQARVQSLERELEEAARRWGREKQQLLTRLSEQEMGFSRTHTTILHHFPTKDPDLSSRRPTKLDPLI